MKAFTPEISWHNRLPALCVDISEPTHDLKGLYRIATGGNDCRVYIWLIDLTSASGPDIKIQAGLRRHQKSVGAVRFAPAQQMMLATGDDDGYIYIWKYRIEDQSQSGASEATQLNSSSEPNPFLNDDGIEDLETWKQHRVLRGHIEDICDLAWSKDGNNLLSGSVDNSAILWDTNKGTKIWCSDLIKGYVQGVAIDPHSQYMAALSSDRTLRIYNFADRRKLNAVRKMNINGTFKGYFADDTVQTFCRRLEFSPDGRFLIAPTCKMIDDKMSKPLNAFLIFERSSFRKPSHYYPTGREVALCARFSPVIYELRNNEMNFWGLPYRLVFAVATSRSVLIYDSQQSIPIGYISQIHLARLTDLAWSADGRLLMITSYDGYSTLITFDKGEFGELHKGPLIEPVTVQPTVAPTPSTMWRFIVKKT